MRPRKRTRIGGLTADSRSRVGTPSAVTKYLRIIWQLLKLRSDKDPEL